MHVEDADKQVQQAEVNDKGDDADDSESHKLFDEFFHNVPFNTPYLTVCRAAWFPHATHTIQHGLTLRMRTTNPQSIKEVTCPSFIPMFPFPPRQPNVKR